MRRRSRSTLPLAVAVLVTLSAPGLAQADRGPQQEPGAAPPLAVPGPGPAPVDRDRPGGPGLSASARDPAPVGGRATVHLEARVSSFNFLIDNSAVTARLGYELHERLVQYDWETWELEPRLARRVVIEDSVVAADGRRLEGLVEREGDELVVTPAAELEGLAHSPAAPTRIPAEGARVLPRTVYTLLLREDVRWHDGHPFDSGDVLFTYHLVQNPEVDCDAQRFAFQQLERVDALGPHAVRFVYREPYCHALLALAGLFVQPAHLLDRRDPDHPDRREGVVPGTVDPDPREEARYLREHPLNQHWVGLGPYRLTKVSDTLIEAERFDGYFDPERAGYLEQVRWRVIRDDHAAFLALQNGELDFSARLTPEDYFGEVARSEAFRERFHTGLLFTPVMTYTVWNTRRAPYDDARVRRALTLAFDWPAFIAGHYRGLARQVTSEIYPGSPYYDGELEPLPHDSRLARELLGQAGWYDRDGDGWVDRDGAPFELELLLPAGSQSALAYGQQLARDLELVGIRTELLVRDWADFSERLGGRDFDGAYLAWHMPVESDPEQLWHSRWVGPHTANHGSLDDPEVDGLIDALQRELDRDRRVELFHRLQRRLYDLQVYAYGVFTPRRFAASNRLRGVQTFSIEPGYSIRRWYVED